MAYSTLPDFGDLPCNAVVVSVSIKETGRAKLFVDDAWCQARVGSGVGWETARCVAEVEVDAQQLSSGRLSQKELAGIGILATLAPQEH